MPGPIQQEKQEIKPQITVIGMCEDGHTTQIVVAPMLAQVGNVTGEQCVKLSREWAGACGKYLKVIQVIGA